MYEPECSYLESVRVLSAGNGLGRLHLRASLRLKIQNRPDQAIGGLVEGFVPFQVYGTTFFPFLSESLL